ncbi:hypothetical protein BDW59DRAFT_54789 [Aspergillus cavernicola]|uniref:Actin-like ATPase domain-containing protein n=1 Tax=Aspergillus cavernicola TaxID=176166 RepID=A0ABR4IJ81_9EURO
MADDWIPDIVVGVDFGMTCTGVAYSYGPNWPPPKSIQHWPGLIGSQIATKVPSHILYHNNTIKWGFQCEQNLLSLDDTRDLKSIKQYFKLNLDPAFIDSRPHAPSREDATRWFQDYIRAVYAYVVDYFGRTLPRFEGLQVEFVFSVPTTWKDPRMVEELRGAIRFDSGCHRAVIGLTEAEAAAVYVSGLHYQKDDVILVCDAGGGTTDVNVLKLVSSPGEPTVYNPLGFVEGKPVGSVFIDLGVHQLLCTKLEPISSALPGTTEDIAWQMMVGRFERFKCSFGVEGEETPALQLELPASVVDPHFPEHGVHNGRLYISSDEVRQIFDAKITDLFDLLDEQIRRLYVSHPSERISFLVLSGGFGSCPYVRKCLTTRYETQSQTKIKVLTVDEPQLAVVQGQVLNRTQQLKSGAPVFQHLYSPVSYGVICDWLYDPKIHLGEQTRYDERNGKTYAINQIDWFVLQGDQIPLGGIQKTFPRKISPRDLNRPFVAQIVLSTLPRTSLPRSMLHANTRTGAGAGTKVICELQVDTSVIEKRPKNHRWYNRAPVYFVVTVVVKLVMRSGGLVFELWDRVGGRVVSSSTSTTTLSTLQGHRASSGAGGGGGPITVMWETMAEKMQDEGDGQRRLSVPLSAVSMQRDSAVSEMTGDVSLRVELPGDPGMGPAQRRSTVKDRSYFAQ